MLVSVVMPSLNNGAFIAEAVMSVLTQEGPDVELVIQDGASTDRTREAVAAFSDPRISFISEPDRGQAQAVNRAIARAHGEWILWMNADDLLLPGALLDVAPHLDAHVDAVVGNFHMVDVRGRTMKTYLSAALDRERLLVRGCYLWPTAVLLRRSVFDRFGYLDETLRYAIDYEFYLRIAPGVTSIHLDRVLGSLRVQEGSNTEARPWGFVRETAMLRKRYGGGRPTVALRAGMNQVALAGYVITRPLWRSTAWRKLRPVRQL